MMNHDFELKLQAYLDGELSAREAAEVEVRAGAGCGRRSRLLTELRNTKAAMSIGEAELKLPETREFFWSKIERQIERRTADGPAPPENLSWFGWVQRHVLAVGGVALLSASWR